MKLPYQSIRKLIRDCFPAQSPIKIDLRRRGDEVKRWRENLEKINGVRVTNHPADNDSRSNTLCRFTIPDPHQDEHYWRSDELRLEYDEELILNITAAAHWGKQALSSPVSSVDEIEGLVRQTLDRYARRHAGENKREKVRRFKTNAILARVDQIAATEKFDYTTVLDDKKFKLYVRLSKRDLIEIQIPFDRFEKVLPELKNTISMMRALCDQGVKLKTGTERLLPWRAEWVRHSDHESST